MFFIFDGRRRAAAMSGRRRALGYALTLACSSAALYSSALQAQATLLAERPAPRPVAPGALAGAVMQYAEDTGVTVLFEPGLVQGLNTAGLPQPTGDVAAGLRRLLQGTGLEAVPRSPGTYILRRLPGGSQVTALAPVMVAGVLDPRDRVYETPASVALVTREQIERLPPRNSADLLHEVTGVYTSSSRSDPGLSVNIRGMQDFGRVNVMIDGARQNYQQSGHGSNGTVYFDPALIGGVEVVKGPVSTVGGAGMIAGMVNFRTLEVDDILQPGRTVGGKAQLSTGSNAYHFVSSLAGAARFGTQADVMAAVSRKNIGAFKVGERGRDDAAMGDSVISRTTRQEHWSGLFKYGWRPADGHAFKLSYLGMDASFIGDMSEQSAYGVMTNGFNVLTHTVKLDYSWQPVDSQRWDVASDIYYTNTRRRNVRSYSDDADRGYNLRYQTETVGGSLSNTSRMEWQDLALQWRNGGEFWHDWTTPIFNDPGASYSEAVWYTGPTPEGKRTVASGFTELTLNYQDWLQAIAGLRYDWFTLSGNGQVYVATVRNPPGVRPPLTTLYSRFSVDRHAGAFAPKLTLALKPASWAQLYVSYGEGLRPPSLTETLMHGMHVGNSFPFYANPGLHEERSRNWEFGLNLLHEGFRAQDTFRLKTAWFDTRVDNYMLASNVMQPGSTISCNGLFCSQAYVNMLDPVSFKGLELQIEYDARTWFGGLTYTRVHADWGAMRYDPFPMGSWVGYPDTNMGSGNQETLTQYLTGGPPQRKIGLTAGLRFLNGQLELGARMRYEKPSTLGFMSQYPQTRAYDAWATWRPVEALTLRLAVENLRNDKYVEVAGGAGGWSWAPGRTVIGSLSYNF